jgi:hypothetical protein
MINTNKAAAMNKLHTWANEACPLIIEELKSGFKLNADGSLCKKDKARFDHILSRAPFRAFLDFSKYSVWLKTDISYSVGEFGCNYYKYHFCVHSNDGYAPLFTELKTDITADYLNNIDAEIKALEKQKQEISSEIFNLQLSIGR